jgi:hypothetical protein
MAQKVAWRSSGRLSENLASQRDLKRSRIVAHQTLLRGYAQARGSVEKSSTSVESPPSPVRARRGQ